MGTMSNSRGWILVIGILLIFALTGVGVVLTLRSATQQAVQPVQELSGSLGTQVAQVLNPTPTVLPDPVTIIHDVRSLARRRETGADVIAFRRSFCLQTRLRCQRSRRDLRLRDRNPSVIGTLESVLHC